MQTPALRQMCTALDHFVGAGTAMGRMLDSLCFDQHLVQKKFRLLWLLAGSSDCKQRHYLRLDNERDRQRLRAPRASSGRGMGARRSRCGSLTWSASWGSVGFDYVDHEEPRTSLFSLPSPGTCGGLHRWSPVQPHMRFSALC